MSPYAQAALAVIGLSSSLTTGIFLFAYFIGKLRGDIDRSREQLADHAAVLISHGRRIEKNEDDLRGLKGDRRRDD